MSTLHSRAVLFRIGRNNIDKPSTTNDSLKYILFEKIIVTGFPKGPICDRHIYRSRHRSQNIFPTLISEKEMIWYKNGKRHNIHGPAFMMLNNYYIEYHFNGTRCTKEEWEKKTKR